ncbi:MAG: DUF2723 domain-containing protein [bacterium]
MNLKLLNRFFGAAVFIITAFVYFSTVQPSVSFWDCGEFIASSFSLQVPHPPGTPFFIILGRIFSLIPFADNIALRVNTVSVLSSAFSILFLYLIAVRLIQNLRIEKNTTAFDTIVTYCAAAIGALSLAFSETFWFNGVEAEVYATSTFFITVVTYLIVLWNDKADEPGSERYLILIAYLIGLSTGVHLMSVLAAVPIIMVIYFRKYVTDDELLKKSGYLFLIHSAIVVAVAFVLWAGITGQTPPMPEDYKAVDNKFVMMALFVSVVFMGIFYKKVFTRNSFYIPILFGGVTLVAYYPGMVKDLPKLISAIAGNNVVFDITVMVLIILLLVGLIYYSYKNKRFTLSLASKCLLFAILGFTSYSMIIIRSNQDTPINLNSPKTFSELESYLNREQYGDFPTFQRRFSQEDHQTEIYTSYSSDLDFLWSYQMNHMFNRYLLWNYAGNSSTVQDAPVDWSVLWGIPFLLGMFGAFYQFKRDWKMGAVFLLMFIFQGYLTAFYQNQQEPQPRERDYFYVGAFFVFSIWIAIGIRGIIDLLTVYFKEQKLLKPVIVGLLVVFTLLVPAKMISANYHKNDRSRNFVPWDYSYNMLQSVEPNAILFTNGDNDTFPLWYLQDVEGVRRDVRIVNLSLLNTPWYILQMKNNTPHGSLKVPMSMTDQQVERIGYARFTGKTEFLPLSDNLLTKFAVTDSTIIANKGLSWNLQPTLNFGSFKGLRVQDLAVLDIIKSSNWERPIYYAVTCSDDSKIGLDNYLKMEGLAFKLVPEKRPGRLEFVNEKAMVEHLFNNSPETYSTTYKPGFRFRGLNDSTIFFDDNHVRLTQNYRNSFLRLALYYLNNKRDFPKVIEVLDRMELVMPRKNIHMDPRLLFDLGSIYYSAGGAKQYQSLAKEIEAYALKQLELNPMDVQSYYNPYRLLLDTYENLREYKKALEIANRLKSYFPNDKNVLEMIAKYTALSNLPASELNKLQFDVQDSVKK